MKKYLLFAALAFGVVSGASAQDEPIGVCGTAIGKFFHAKIDTIPSRGVAQNYLLWDNGSTLRVKFLPGGSRFLRFQVMNYAKLWEQYANIKFDFVPDDHPDTQIRIRLTDHGGAVSVIGNAATQVSQREFTMSFDTVAFKERAGQEYWRATVIHEFGHALGLLHEQGYPGSIAWNKENLYSYYQRTNGWSRAETDRNVFAVHDMFYTNGTQYDPRSIMHYPIHSWQTLDGKAVPVNYDLSDGDKRLIGYLYPKVGGRFREVPRVTLSNVSRNVLILDSRERNTLYILPSFDIQTSNQLGEVWWVATFYDEFQNPIRVTRQDYIYGGTVATYGKMNLFPRTKASFNRSNYDFALGIPMDKIPGFTGKKVHVLLSALLRDQANDKWVPIYQSEPVAFNMPSY